MKTYIRSLTGFLMLSFILGMVTSCQDKTYEEITYKAQVPIVMGFDEFRSAVTKSGPQELVTPGKIYFKDNYIFVNEFQEGIHVIDNSNPEAPQIITFITIPGNMDMAIKGNILYADSYIDLVAIDISDPANPVEVDRIEDAFPNVLPPVEDFSMPVYGLDFTKGVVVGWETKEVTEVVERENSSGFGGKIMEDATGRMTWGQNEVSINPATTGIGGSMARFTLVGENLFALHNNNLKQFNVGTVPGMTTGVSVPLAYQVETLFPNGNNLFMGTTTGMVIYNVSNPSSPQFVSVFQHINSCDPVVIEGNYAYVTLRSGTQCNNFTNQLDVVNISSLEHPYLEKSYPMYNPYGLGIDNHILFICDGDAGLKVYDATNPLEINLHQLAHFENIKTYDIIPYDGIAMMIGEDGLYQYDYSNLDSLRLLSHLPIGN